MTISFMGDWFLHFPDTHSTPKRKKCAVIRSPSGIRVPSEFVLNTLLDNFPVESPTDKDSCTKSVYK